MRAHKIFIFFFHYVTRAIFLPAVRDKVCNRLYKPKEPQIVMLGRILLLVFLKSPSGGTRVVPTVALKSEKSLIPISIKGHCFYCCYVVKLLLTIERKRVNYTPV